jgi:uncharacterized protein (DUF2252 family)
MGIRAANRDYERWLARELHGDIVEADLGKKHKKMRDSAFSFLRATYWRWAETILNVCPDLANAPPVLAVGDIHLENFGTWRDQEGRLIWGVNDYDEAAEIPYILDLVRLATSAALATAATDLAQGDLHERPGRLRARHRSVRGLCARPPAHVAAHALRGGRG